MVLVASSSFGGCDTSSLSSYFNRVNGAIAFKAGIILLLSDRVMLICSRCSLVLFRASLNLNTYLAQGGLYHYSTNPAFLLIIQDRGFMLDGVDQTPAFIYHFVLEKTNDFPQFAPSRIEKPAYLDSATTRLINKGLLVILFKSMGYGDVGKRID